MTEMVNLITPRAVKIKPRTWATASRGGRIWTADLTGLENNPNLYTKTYAMISKTRTIYLAKGSLVLVGIQIQVVKKELVTRRIIA